MSQWEGLPLLQWTLNELFGFYIDKTLQLYWGNWLLFGYGSPWRQMMKYPLCSPISQFFCKQQYSVGNISSA